jgi:signal transduction histidine kinase
MGGVYDGEALVRGETGAMRMTPSPLERPGWAPWRQLSLFQKQACLVTVVVVIAGVVTGLVCYRFARLQLQDQIHRRLASLAHDRAVIVNLYVEQQKERVSLIASRTSLRKHLAAALQDTVPFARVAAEVQVILEDARKPCADFLSIQVTDPSGRVLAATRGDPVGGELAGTAEFESGCRGPFLGAPTWVGGRYEGLLFAPAVSNDGVFLGVVVVTLDMTPLRKLLDDHCLQQEKNPIWGHLWLNDPRRVTWQDARKPERSTRVDVGYQEGQRVYYLFQQAGREGDDDARLGLPTEQAEPMRLATLGAAPGFGNFSYRGSRVLAAWQPIAYHDPRFRAWGLLVAVDEDEALAPVARLGRLLFLVVSLVLGLSLGIAYVMTERWTRRLLRLAAAADDVAKGNLSRRVPVHSGDEIGRLGAAFNTMNEQLADSYQFLERRVQERTDELARSNRDLEQFAYVASHDLQEPLRKIEAFGELLVNTHASQLGSDGVDYVRRMRSAAMRMRTLISDLLTYARVSLAGQPLIPVDLNAIVAEVLADLELRVLESGARVELGTLPTVLADRTQMRQLLQNLIGNALKYHQPGRVPVLRIRGQGEGGDKLAELVVEDEGIGIDVEDRERVFALLQRGMSRAHVQGHGIGLALCRRIVERHGGRLELESEPGVGSQFRVWLPAAAEAELPPSGSKT